VHVVNYLFPRRREAKASHGRDHQEVEPGADRSVHLSIRRREEAFHLRSVGVDSERRAPVTRLSVPTPRTVHRSWRAARDRHRRLLAQVAPRIVAAGRTGRPGRVPQRRGGARRD